MLSAIQKAVDLLRHSAATVALTGAGISTPSGIPDFRSAKIGLWSQVDPFEVASIWGFYAHPEAFYDWIRPVLKKLVMARPNAAHQALAAMEQHGLLEMVLTQNVDSLHQAAGNRQVQELHGHTRTATCLACNHRTPTAPFWPLVLDGGIPPPCPECGGLLKPDVILYGEPLPYGAIVAAQQAALHCDVMLVIGTSLEVMPAADLPWLTRRRGGRVILVNLTATYLDDQADVVIQADVVQTLRELWKALVK
ncbi:MAG: NAD-dependent deacylase [Chloroflexi bacterium]|nr:NAD-dependent deacylase [Chloroflexota bacterium]